MTITERLDERPLDLGDGRIAGGRWSRAEDPMTGVKRIVFTGNSLTDGEAWPDWVIATLQANGRRASPNRRLAPMGRRVPDALGCHAPLVETSLYYASITDWYISPPIAWKPSAPVILKNMPEDLLSSWNSQQVFEPSTIHLPQPGTSSSLRHLELDLRDRTIALRLAALLLESLGSANQ